MNSLFVNSLSVNSPPIFYKLLLSAGESGLACNQENIQENVYKKYKKYEDKSQKYPRFVYKKMVLLAGNPENIQENTFNYFNRIVIMVIMIIYR